MIDEMWGGLGLRHGMPIRWEGYEWGVDLLGR